MRPNYEIVFLTVGWLVGCKAGGLHVFFCWGRGGVSQEKDVTPGAASHGPMTGEW